jgi:hypothetical protein
MPGELEALTALEEGELKSHGEGWSGLASLASVLKQNSMWVKNGDVLASQLTPLATMQ